MSSVCCTNELVQGETTPITARLKPGETLGDRIMKVDHAGEHGAICIYSAQIWFARWRVPTMVPELEHFLAHERGHRALFQAQLDARGRDRCRSFHLCGLGGIVLGAVTGLLGRGAIAATTVAIERVVLRHMQEQLVTLREMDIAAVETLQRIIHEEQEHHDLSVARLASGSIWQKLIEPIVATSTEAVIWLGMRL